MAKNNFMSGACSGADCSYSFYTKPSSGTKLHISADGKVSTGGASVRWVGSNGTCVWEGSRLRVCLFDLLCSIYSMHLLTDAGRNI